MQRTGHKDPEKAIKETFLQIENKKYEKDLLAEGYENIMKMVIVTDKKEVWVSVDGEEAGKMGRLVSLCLQRQ